MAGPTRAELQTTIENLESQVEYLKGQIAERDAVLSESGEDGWLIEVKNKKYNGVTNGVAFKNGYGFVPRARKDSAALVAALKSDYGYVIHEATAGEYQAVVSQEIEEVETGLSLEDILEPQPVGG